MKKTLRSKKGELLIELLMSISLFALLVSTVVTMLTMSIRTFNTARDLRQSTAAEIAAIETKTEGGTDKEVQFSLGGLTDSNANFIVTIYKSDDEAITRYVWKETEGG